MGTVGNTRRFVFLMDLTPLLFLVLGLLVGGGVVFLVFRIRGDAARQIEVSSLNERLSQRDEQISEQKAGLQHAETELRREQERATNSERLHAVAVQQIKEADRRTKEQKELLKEAEKAFREAFEALSSRALKQNNEQFLELAQESLAKTQEQAKGELEKKQQAVDALVKPLKETMDAVKKQIETVEKDRTSAYAALREQVASLTETQKLLRSETANLVTALRAPQVRGRWGEIQLRRVVEMAGMINYCDFEEQTTIQTEDGRLRPDMIIRLPNERRIVVDSKAPLQAYLEALETDDDTEREAHLKRHAAQVRTHIKQLSAKAYTQHLGFTPEFIVLFLPGETFFSAALEQDPGLIEHGVDRNVILATPTTLIALLKAVHYGWRQEALTENAMKIKELGEELYRRTSVLAEHFSSIGRHLNQTVGAYNKSVGSLEKRFLPTVRQFKELGAASGDEIPEVMEVTTTLRGVEEGEQLALEPTQTEETPLLDS